MYNRHTIFLKAVKNMVKCKQCENDFDEYYGICPKCGCVYEAEEKLPDIKPVANTFPELKNYSEEKPVAKKKSKAKLFVIIGIIAVVIIAGIIVGIFIATSNKGGKSEFDAQISLGEKYLGEENYDEAIATFKKAIEIEPNNPEAYIRLADTYLAKGDTENAVKALESGYEKTDSDKIKTKLDKLKNGDSSEESLTEEEFSKEEYKDPEYTLGNIVASGECGDNVTWELDNNGLLVISGSGEMQYYDISSWDKGSIKTVIVKKGVTRIGDRAFEKCTSLTSITIPDSVTSIGNSAFEKCTSLTSITIPDSVTSIEHEAFYNCTSLTSITIPDSVTSIGYKAFYNTPWYYSQPDGVVYAGKAAYEYKGVMPANTNIVLKEGTKGITKDAFINCTSLTSITIPDSVTSIGNSAFENCTSLTSITIPDSVTRIESLAFKKCTSLTSITIPDSVTSIGDKAFSECTSLTSITIPNSVTSIGNWVFESCTGLTSITIPDSVTSIEYEAFCGCTSLTSITIPDSVTSIGQGSFRNTAWYHSQPDGVVYAGRTAYEYKGVMPSNTNIVLKEGTKGIAVCAFEDCTSLTSITIPDSVTSIEYGAFEDCTSLTSITIPDSVTSIGG